MDCLPSKGKTNHIDARFDYMKLPLGQNIADQDGQRLFGT